MGRGHRGTLWGVGGLVDTVGGEDLEDITGHPAVLLGPRSPTPFSLMLYGLPTVYLVKPIQYCSLLNNLSKLFLGLCSGQGCSVELH